MKKASTYLSALALLCVALTLTGCGYKGPLTLPEPTFASHISTND